jgi:drug/metabolite transporter, DME family
VSTHTVARLQAIAAAALFSTGGAGIKVESMTGIQVSCLRSGIAAVVLLMWLRWSGHVNWVRLRSLPVLGTGVAYAACLTLFVLATKLTTAATAIILQSTAPLYILLLAPIIIGERLRPRDIGYLLALAAGVILCVVSRPVASVTAPDPETGRVLAIVCSIAWAFTLLGLRYVGRDDPGGGLGPATVALGNIFACLAGLPFVWPLPTAPAAEWATVAYLGVFQIGLAYVCLTSALRRLPALEASLLLLIEPVLNPLWAWLIRGEQPGRWTIVGGAVVLAATAFRAIYDARMSSAASSPTSVPSAR